MSTENGSTSQKYGVPIYGAAWVPPSAVPKDKTENEAEAEAETESSSSSATIRHVILAGGGGEGRSGIPNAILLSSFDSVSLPEDPVARLGTGSDLPYRIAVHPGGEGVLCSLPTSCKWFEFEAENRVLNITESERVLEKLEDVGQQLAMTFNSDGNLLAVGGEDGKLRVFKWPAMENIIDEENAHSRVKDLDFSSDGKLLVSVGSGPGRIWNVSTSAAQATLSTENDEIFSFCRFSQSSDTDQVLYITANRDKGGSIIKWNTTSWKRISSTYVGRDGITAFNVSPDGKLLVIGTNEGGILILSTTSMRVQTVVKKAHLAFVTAVAFSQDSRAVLSASLDSSVRVTLVQDVKDGMSAWMILCIIVLLIAIVAVSQSHLMLKVKNSFL